MMFWGGGMTFRGLALCALAMLAMPGQLAAMSLEDAVQHATEARPAARRGAVPAEHEQRPADDQAQPRAPTELKAARANSLSLYSCSSDKPQGQI